MSPPTLSPLCFLFLILCLVMFHLSLSKLWGFSSLLHGSGICAGPRRILWRNFGGRSGSFRSGNQNVDESTVSIDLHSPRSSFLPPLLTLLPPSLSVSTFKLDGNCFPQRSGSYRAVLQLEILQRLDGRGHQSRSC